MNQTQRAVSDFAASVTSANKAIKTASDLYVKAVQALVNKHRVHLATGHLSDTWQVKTLRGKHWRDDMDEPKHPIFADLEQLDKVAIQIGIGPTNMERYTPQN
jgi:hypothetical protein